MNGTTAKLPVIIGVGQINDRETAAPLAKTSLELMQAALRAAAVDAGGNWLKRLDSLAVVDHVSFPEPGDEPARLAHKIGASPRLCRKTPSPSGDSPILLLNEAANGIAAGEIDVAAVAGGEALRSWVAQGAPGKAPAGSPSPAPSYAQLHGLISPADIYPLYENAGRAAYGQTLACAQIESSAIWSLFSEVATHSEGAWLRKFLPPHGIRATGPDNRMIAFPYPKLMVANSAVNQGAAFILSSRATAIAAGISESRMIYVGHGAAAHEPDDILARDSYSRSSGMEVSLRRALTANGLEVGDIDFIELYSCFPCIPKMARRVIGWPLEQPASVFGGLTFGGGPIGNYMSHAVAAMVEKLRTSGEHGLLFGNGGFATRNHSIVIGRSPPRRCAGRPRQFDFQSEAQALRGPVPRLVEHYTGPGTVETYTVPYRRDGVPRFAVVIARSPQGERFLARVPSEDEAGLDLLTAGVVEPVGMAGRAMAGENGIAIWRW